jgi:hypothetical protein
MENPTITIEFNAENNSVAVKWNGAVKSIEFVLAMLDMAKLNVSDFRSAARLQQMQQGIQPALGTRDLLANLNLGNGKRM